MYPPHGPLPHVRHKLERRVPREQRAENLQIMLNEMPLFELSVVFTMTDMLLGSSCQSNSVRDYLGGLLLRHLDDRPDRYLELK